MRKRLGSSLMALTVATLMAGAFSGCNREMGVTGDPRIEGIINHTPVEADPNILADPRTLKTGGRSGAVTPTPAATTRTATASAPATTTAPGPESAPATGPETGPADPDAFVLRIDRAASVGMTYDTQISAEQAVSLSGAPDQNMKVELAGRMAVVAIDDKGLPTEFNLNVTKFDIDGKEAVAAGKVINAKKGAKDFGYTIVSGETLTDPAKDALKLVFDSTAIPVVDDIVGSKGHKQGESWPLDAEAAAKLIAKIGSVAADPKSVTGQATINGVETVNGVKALRVAAVIDAKDLKAPDASATMENSDMKVGVEGLFPVDTTVRPMETSVTMDTNMHMTAPLKMDVKGHLTKKETITPVK